MRSHAFEKTAFKYSSSKVQSFKSYLVDYEILRTAKSTAEDDCQGILIMLMTLNSSSFVRFQYFIIYAALL